MATYAAVSNLGTNEWEYLGKGPTREAAEQAAYAEIDKAYPDRTDIFNDTLRANLRVLPWSKAQKIAPCAFGDCDHGHDLDYDD